MKVEFYVFVLLVLIFKGKCDVLVLFYCYLSLKWGNIFYVLFW